MPKLLELLGVVHRRSPLSNDDGLDVVVFDRDEWMMTFEEGHATPAVRSRFDPLVGFGPRPPLGFIGRGRVDPEVGRGRGQ